MSTPEVTRFAPSPSGYLHLGHAFAALFAARAAGPPGAGGRFLLRIEDIDGDRVRPEYEAAIFEDLAWLGLDWQAPLRRQSDCMADYAWALERLRRQGLLYPCFCTRKEIAAEIAGAGDLRGDLLSGAKAGIEQPLPAQTLERPGIVGHAVGLAAQWRLPVETEPGQILKDRGFVLGPHAVAVDVLDAQQEAPAGARRTGGAGGKKGRESMAQVQVAAGRRREAGDFRCRHAIGRKPSSR